MMKINSSSIIRKYLSGRFPPDTEERVQRWLINDENMQEKASASFVYWDSLEQDANDQTLYALERVNKKINYTQNQKTKIPLFKKLGRVAAVLIPLFIIAGGYFYYQSTAMTVIEIHAAYGEEKHLFLPDSSEVWINAGSTVKFPKDFRGNQRLVQLDGEAYFSVRSNESKPFTVSTEKLSVNVLGTKFNVKAYRNDEQVTTTLTSGKVEVKSANIAYILKPNERLILDKKTSVIDITEIPPDETDAWKSGRLIFNNASLSEIIRTLERHFNITIKDHSGIPASRLYTIKFLKNENLREILDIMQDVVSFSYVENDGQIILSKK